MACYHTTDYAYGNVIYQLRAIQIYAMLTQVKKIKIFEFLVLLGRLLFAK